MLRKKNFIVVIFLLVCVPLFVACVKSSAAATDEPVQDKQPVKADITVTGVHCLSKNLVYGTDISLVVLGYTSATADGVVTLAGEQQLIAGTHDYTWVFTPMDTETYNKATGVITLTVAKAEFGNVAVSLSSDTIYFDEELPEIFTTSDGTIAFDPSQTVTLGELLYTWTFTPNNPNFNEVKGAVTVIVTKYTRSVNASAYLSDFSTLVVTPNEGALYSLDGSVPQVSNVFTSLACFGKYAVTILIAEDEKYAETVYTFTKDTNEDIFTCEQNTITGLTAMGKSLVDVVVPESVNSDAIEIIGAGAFAFCPLKSVVLPPTIITISALAFAGTDINYIVLGAADDSVAMTIVAGAFKDSNMDIFKYYRGSDYDDLTIHDCYIGQTNFAMRANDFFTIPSNVFYDYPKSIDPFADA